MITLKFKNKPSCWAADEKIISPPVSKKKIAMGIFNFPSFGGSGDNKFVLESLCKMLRIKKYQIVEIFG